MFLPEDTHKPVRNAYWYSANRMLLVLLLQGFAVGMCLWLVPRPSDPNAINLRETLASAILMLLGFFNFWWLAKKGMDV